MELFREHGVLPAIVLTSALAFGLGGAYVLQTLTSSGFIAHEADARYSPCAASGCGTTSDSGNERVFAENAPGVDVTSLTQPDPLEPPASQGLSKEELHDLCSSMPMDGQLGAVPPGFAGDPRPGRPYRLKRGDVVACPGFVPRQ